MCVTYVRWLRPFGVVCWCSGQSSEGQITSFTTECRSVVCCPLPVIQRLGRRRTEKLAEKVGRREIYPPVPSRFKGVFATTWRVYACSSSLQCGRFLWARNLLAKTPCWNLWKRGGNGASPPFPSFALAPAVRVYSFLLSPIFHCHKIKDGGYSHFEHERNTNKVSPTQNTGTCTAG